MTETRKCPMCAETIPADSVFCPYCGTRFGEKAQAAAPPKAPTPFAPAPATPVPAPPKKNRGLWWIIGGAVAIVLCVVLVTAGVLIYQNRIQPAATFSTIAPTLAPNFISTPQPATATAPAVLTGTVTIWHPFSPGSPDENALLTVIQNAEAENPGLAVIATYHSSENNYYLDEYNAAVSTGGGPDILLAWNEKVGDMVRAGTVLDLQGYATEDHLVGIQQYALDGLTIDGKLYALPETSNIVALYYNKVLLPTPPTTTDNLLSLVKAGKKLGIIDYPPYWLYGFWSGFGVQIQDEDGRCNAGQSGFIPAVQYILDLQKAGAVQANYEETQNRFLNGQTSMIINGSWALAGYKEALGNDLGVAILPGGPAGPSKPITGVSGFFINPNADQPDVAFLLALYMSSQASAQIFMDQAGQIPVRDDVIISDPLLYTLSLAAAQGTPRAENKQFDNYWDPFSQMFNDTLSGAVTPQVGIQRACETMNSLNGLP